MTKTKVILTLTFLLVFAAGAVVGMVRNRVAGPRHHGPDDRESFMTRLLDLTPDQQEQMKKIWSELGPGRGDGRAEGDRRREFQKQRDDAIRSMLSDQQKTKYEAIQKEYADRVADLGRERQLAFQQAVERTKAILSPDQAAKYDAFLSKRREGMGPGGPPGDRDRGPGGPPPPWRDRDRRPSETPTTHPAPI